MKTHISLFFLLLCFNACLYTSGEQQRVPAPEQSQEENDYALLMSLLHRNNQDIESLHNGLTKLTQEYTETGNRITKLMHKAGLFLMDISHSEDGATIEVENIRSLDTLKIDLEDKQESADNSSAKTTKKHKRSRTKIHQCTICNKIFYQKSHLNRHKLTHTGEKPFKCTQCNKSFARSDNLTVHMRSHTGEKPFKCDQCDEAFADSKALKKHECPFNTEYTCKLCPYTNIYFGSFLKHAKKHKDSVPTTTHDT